MRETPEFGPDLSESDAEQIADTMFALASPVRVRLLGFLMSGPHTVSELMSATGLEQSAVSHQLRVLRDHRLVSAERRGRLRVYALADEHVPSLIEEAWRHVRRSSAGDAASRFDRMLRRAE